jgi:hypothetical protein
VTVIYLYGWKTSCWLQQYLLSALVSALVDVQSKYMRLNDNFEEISVVKGFYVPPEERNVQIPR